MCLRDEPLNSPFKRAAASPEDPGEFWILAGSGGRKYLLPPIRLILRDLNSKGHSPLPHRAPFVIPHLVGERREDRLVSKLNEGLL